MKKNLLLAMLIILLFVAVGASAQIALATTHPLRPGHAVFPMQDFAEQARGQLILSDPEQTAYYLELADLRTDDLLVLVASDDSFLAADYLEQALERLILSLNGTTGEAAFLRDVLQDLVVKLNMVINDLESDPSVQVAGIELLQARVLTIETLLSDLSGGEMAATNAELEQIIQAAGDLENGESGSGSTQVPPHEILFPPGSPGAEHAFLVLDGAHKALECLDCHVDGQYAGTSDLCIDCHVERMPDFHYGENCAGCHATSSWQEVVFDHGLLDTSDCQACHLEKAPAGHYTGACSACHNSEDWDQADFNHNAVDAKDCQFCHANDRPGNHYQAQCSACHNTTSWSQASFNHQAVGAADCKACHSGRQPANHYSGQCSACHNTTSWSQASFNHQAVGATDCKACHSGRKPANHFGGQCSACHSTSKWSGAQFKHGAAGATDCKACHSGRKPANHFDGQCSKCHNTSSWGGASFNHKFPVNQGDANGNCSSCHPSGGSKYNCFACHDKAKINNEHNEEGISNFAGRCLACHPRGKEGGGDD